MPAQVPQQVRRDDVKVDLVFDQFPADDLFRLVIACPFALAVVEDGDVGEGDAAADQMADPVHVLDQRAERPVLGVLAVGVEMGRAVGVGEGLRGEGVGGEVVDAPGEEVVGQVLHRPHTGAPAVGPEVFAEGPAALAGVDVGMGRAELAQLIVVEFPVAGLRKALRSDRVAAADHHLAADVVDAGHMLPGEAPEVVAHAGAEAGVGAVVLDDVADILYAVGGAPVTQLPGKAPFHQPGDAVHIPDPDLCVLPAVVHIRPEDRQEVLPVVPQTFF